MSVAVETRRTFCRVCHVACPLDVDVDVAADKVLAVRGVANTIRVAPSRNVATPPLFLPIGR